MLWPESKTYQHVTFVNPDEATTEALGWFLRLRGVGTQVISEVGIISAVTYLTQNWWVTAGLAGLALALISWTWTRRMLVLKVVRLARHLHSIAHWNRDKLGEIRTALLLADQTRDYGQYDALYKNVNDEVVNRISRYFEELIEERTTCCAIRLAVPHNNTTAYRTIARSQEMWKDMREQQSMPIPEDKGVARILRQKDQYGVFFVWDIAEARKDPDIWYPTPTDEFPDVKYVMVAPINGYVFGERRAFGLLYITTKRKRLRLEYAEHLMAFSDMLGLLYPAITRETEERN